MRVILSPFHLDERLDGSWPLAPDEMIDPALPAGTAWERMTVIARDVAGAVARARADGAVPLVLSGDCVAALAVVAGVQADGSDPHVIWLDAHGDLHTPESSSSGYLGGQPVRQLLGDADRTVPDAIGLRRVDEAALTLMDGRDLDPPEAAFLAASRMRQLPLQAIAVPGPVVLHVDLDVVDGGELPGLLYPVGGGPSLERALAVLTQLLEHDDVVAISLGCTTDERASDAAVRIAGLLATD
jgi:arginase